MKDLETPLNVLFYVPTNDCEGWRRPRVQLCFASSAVVDGPLRRFWISRWRALKAGELQTPNKHSGRNVRDWEQTRG